MVSTGELQSLMKDAKAAFQKAEGKYDSFQISSLVLRTRIRRKLLPFLVKEDKVLANAELSAGKDAEPRLASIAAYRGEYHSQLLFDATVRPKKDGVTWTYSVSTPLSQLTAVRNFEVQQTDGWKPLIVPATRRDAANTPEQEAMNVRHGKILLKMLTAATKAVPVREAGKTSFDISAVPLYISPRNARKLGLLK